MNTPGENRDSASDDRENRDGAVPRGVRAMAGVRWALVALMAVAAATSILSYPGLRARAGGAADAGVTIYTCPMHPQVAQDHPGECPICGMTLVPRVRGGGKSPAAPSAPTVAGLGAV